jgi:2-polyprenyl-3-methyl-5-hydroxy-6-metoxy-1,4-benzoquinol methylase
MLFTKSDIARPVHKRADVLDIGTGTGVIPRSLYKYGAHFTGADISAMQIEKRAGCPPEWISNT